MVLKAYLATFQLGAGMKMDQKMYGLLWQQQTSFHQFQGFYRPGVSLEHEQYRKTLLLGVCQEHL